MQQSLVKLSWMHLTHNSLNNLWMHHIQLQLLSQSFQFQKKYWLHHQQHQSFRSFQKSLNVSYHTLVSLDHWDLFDQNILFFFSCDSLQQLLNQKFQVKLHPHLSLESLIVHPVSQRRFTLMHQSFNVSFKNDQILLLETIDLCHWNDSYAFHSHSLQNWFKHLCSKLHIQLQFQLNCQLFQ